jgi:hypothetical protein
MRVRPLLFSVRLHLRLQAAGLQILCVGSTMTLFPGRVCRMQSHFLIIFWDGNHADTSGLLSYPLSCSIPWRMSLVVAKSCNKIITIIYRPLPLFDDDDECPFLEKPSTTFRA